MHIRCGKQLGGSGLNLVSVYTLKQCQTDVDFGAYRSIIRHTTYLNENQD